MQTCSACQDLHTVQIWSKSQHPFCSYCPYWQPLLQTNLGRVSPFNASYQNCCKKTYVNDSQNLAFATSHFVIELLPFDYLSNQKQWVNKKMHFKKNRLLGASSYKLALHQIFVEFLKTSSDFVFMVVLFVSK
jgi:hypothetical protein